MEKDDIGTAVAIGVAIVMVFVLVVAVVTAIFIPQFTGASHNAKESTLRSDLQTVRAQLELYKIQHGDRYPDPSTFVNDLTTEGADGYGPYLQAMPANAFNSRADVKFEAGTAGLGDGSTGWHFDTTTGRFSPNDNPAHAAW